MECNDSEKFTSYFESTGSERFICSFEFICTGCSSCNSDVHWIDGVFYGGLCCGGYFDQWFSTGKIAKARITPYPSARQYGENNETVKNPVPIGTPVRGKKQKREKPRTHRLASTGEIAKTWKTPYPSACQYVGKWKTWKTPYSSACQYVEKSQNVKNPVPIGTPVRGESQKREKPRTHRLVSTWEKTKTWKTPYPSACQYGVNHKNVKNPVPIGTPVRGK